MPMPEAQLRDRLGSEEPEYAGLAAALDESDIPALKAIAEGADLGIATKAIYLASLLESPAAKQIVVDAADSGEELKRIAAGSGLVNLPEAQAERVALRLLDEPSPALAKLVLREVHAPSPELAAKIRAIGENAYAPAELRSMAQEMTRGE